VSWVSVTVAPVRDSTSAAVAHVVCVIGASLRN
jgi:hypothetical protein